VNNGLAAIFRELFLPRRAVSQNLSQRQKSGLARLPADADQMSAAIVHFRPKGIFCLAVSVQIMAYEDTAVLPCPDQEAGVLVDVFRFSAEAEGPDTSRPETHFSEKRNKFRIAIRVY